MTRVRSAALLVTVALVPALAGGTAAPAAAAGTTGGEPRHALSGDGEQGGGPAALGEPAPAGGPEPLWVPDPESLAAVRERRARADARSTATIAADPGLDDGASHVAIAHWMAGAAREAGLPGELPVMAALVESGLRNLPFGDADSVGFFQMRLSVWDHGAYAGYLARPELQLRWFVDHAVALRDARRAAGDAAFGEGPAGWGAWIADVERPYEAYRGRYQTQLDAARALLAQPADAISPLELGLTVGEPAAPPPDPAGDRLAGRVLADDRITVEARSRSDLETAGRVDPRVSAVLLAAAKLFPISLWVIETGHSYYTAGGSVSNHSAGRAVDIGSVGGELVTPANEDAKALALALGRLPARLRPTEIGTPWTIDEPAYFTDGDHQDHLHVGFDDPATAGDGAVAAALLGAAPVARGATAIAPRAEPRFEAGDARARDTAAEPRFEVRP